MFLRLLIIASVLWILYFWFKRRNLYRLAAKIPEVEGHLPLAGVAHKFTGDNEAIMSTLQQFSYASMRNDGLVTIWLGPKLYFMMVDPVDLEYVLKNCLEKDLHQFVVKIIGNGGLFAPVSIWRNRRKILVPIFSRKILESFVEVFVEQSQKLVKKLSDCTGKGKILMWPYFSTYTLDSVCETTLGVQIHAQENPDSVFLNSMNRVLILLCQRIFHLWLQPDWLFSFFPEGKEHDKCRNALYDFTDEVIMKKREEIKKEESSKTKSDKEYDLASNKRITLLDHLIKLSGGDKGFTNVELREETLTLAIAGTDTSAIAMAFTMQLLAKYPKIQEKVYQELYDIYGNSDRLLVKDDLQQLKYMERVVKETLRLFPPVPFIVRKVMEDVKLPSGRMLPAGASIMCSIWGVQRDPKYWGPTAEEFDPDRFLPERFNLKHPCNYMPFSYGPRNCVGYQYALMSVKTALSTVLRQYKVIEDIEDGPAPRIRVKLDITLKAVEGCPIALEKRIKMPTEA